MRWRKDSEKSPKVSCVPGFCGPGYFRLSKKQKIKETRIKMPACDGCHFSIKKTKTKWSLASEDFHKKLLLIIHSDDV